MLCAVVCMVMELCAVCCGRLMCAWCRELLASGLAICDMIVLACRDLGMRSDL